MTPSAGPSRFQHLLALLLAAVFCIPALLLAVPVFRAIEHRHLRELLAQPFDEKDRGMLLQEIALRERAVVSIYGSSELRNEMGQRPDELFVGKPLGFEVCPIGAAGNTTLMMAQKIGAQGSSVEGQKVVCILSHTWFRRLETPPSQVAGNFSPLQTISLVLDSGMDDDLRRRFAKRMLDYPEALTSHPLIAAYLKCKTEEGRMAELEESALRPLLWLVREWLVYEDHLNTLEAIAKYELEDRETPELQWRTAGWRRRIREKEAEITPEQKQWMQDLKLPDHGASDADFLEMLNASKEWADFALLLDTLKDLKADALIISVPMPGPSLNKKGISRAAREQYYGRLEKMCAQRGIPVETFSDQDQSLDFLEGSGTHLEVKGWLYVDKLLDAFYHDRLPELKKAR